MALIEINKEDEKRARRYISEHDFNYSLIEGKNRREIFYLDDFILEDLDEQQIRYEIIKERDIKEKLSEKGLRFYDLSKRMREQAEKVFLAPAGHVTAHFSAREQDIEESKKIISRYTKLEPKIEAESITFSFPYLEGVPEGKMIFAHIPRQFRNQLIEDLASANIAGFNRETRIYFHDPDRRN